VIGVDFCPDGELLAAADDNGRVYLWDLVGGHLVRTFVRRRSQSMNGVAFGLGGDVLAGANDDGRIYLWDVVSGRLAETFLNPDSQGVISVTFDRDTELLAAADDNGRVYLWDVVSGELAATLGHPDSEGVNDVAFSPGGELLAAADGSGKTCVWDVASGQLARAFTDSGDSAFYALSSAPDGRILAAGEADGHVYLWDLVDGSLAETFENPDSKGVNGVAFSPHGDVLAAADGNGRPEFAPAVGAEQRVRIAADLDQARDRARPQALVELVGHQVRRRHDRALSLVAAVHDRVQLLQHPVGGVLGAEVVHVQQVDCAEAVHEAEHAALRAHRLAQDRQQARQRVDRHRAPGVQSGLRHQHGQRRLAGADVALDPQAAAGSVTFGARTEVEVMARSIMILKQAA